MFVDLMGGFDLRVDVEVLISNDNSLLEVILFFLSESFHFLDHIISGDEDSVEELWI